MLKVLLRPAVVLPALLGVALLVALLTFGDVPKVGALMFTFQRSYLVAIVGLLVAYEAVQCTQWNVLLRASGVKASLRARIFAFLVGEMTRVLPIGNYVENYLLFREEGTDFGRSSAATTVSVLIEVGVCLTGVVIIGLDDWRWLRPLIVGGVLLFLLIVLLAHRFVHFRGKFRWLTRYRAVRKVQAEVAQFAAGAACLVRPGILAQATALGATYLVLAGTVLYLVVRGLGVDNISWPGVLAAYFFSIAFSLIFPLPIDIGVYEASGVGALLAIGLARSDAVTAMLSMRIVTTGAAVVIALATMLILRDEVRAVLRDRTPTPSGRHASP